LFVGTVNTKHAILGTRIAPYRPISLAGKTCTRHFHRFDLGAERFMTALVSFDMKSIVCYTRTIVACVGQVGNFPVQKGLAL